jgi:hypothetical protein
VVSCGLWVCRQLGPPTTSHCWAAGVAAALLHWLGCGDDQEGQWLPVKAVQACCAHKRLGMMPLLHPSALRGVAGRFRGRGRAPTNRAEAREAGRKHPPRTRRAPASSGRTSLEKTWSNAAGPTSLACRHSTAVAQAQQRLRRRRPCHCPEGRGQSARSIPAPGPQQPSAPIIAAVTVSAAASGRTARLATAATGLACEGPSQRWCCGHADEAQGLREQLAAAIEREAGLQMQMQAVCGAPSEAWPSAVLAAPSSGSSDAAGARCPSLSEEMLAALRWKVIRRRLDLLLEDGPDTRTGIPHTQLGHARPLRTPTKDSDLRGDLVVDGSPVSTRSLPFTPLEEKQTKRAGEDDRDDAEYEL